MRSRVVEYKAWWHAKNRCINKNHKDYKDYGGRGIAMCQEWINSFDSFMAYIGPKPNKSLVLDRINNNGNYEPGNVRWTDRNCSINNRRCKSTDLTGLQVTKETHALVKKSAKFNKRKIWAEALLLITEALEHREKGV